jgi:hypothetical protein
MKANRLPRRFRPPILKVDDLNAIVDLLRRLAELTVGQGLLLDDYGSGRTLSLPRTPRVVDARITGTDQEAGRANDHALAAGVTGYSWVQCEPSADGTWPDLPNGLAGYADRDPAVPPPGAAAPAKGARVRLLEGPAQALADGVPSSAWWVLPTGAGGLLRGKLDGAMAFGGSAVLSVWAWTGSAEADTGENVTVWDWLLSSGQTIAAGKNVVAGFIGGRWYVLSAQC